MQFPTWRPVGGGLGDKGLGEEEGRGDGVAEVTKQECSRGGQGTGSAVPSPSPVNEGTSSSPGPVQMIPHPTGVLSGTRCPWWCHKASGRLLPQPPPQPARSQYVNTMLFSSVPRLSEEVCSSPVALPHHILLILSGLTPPLCPLTSLLAPPPQQLPPSVCKKHTAKLLKQKTAGFDRII